MTSLCNYSHPEFFNTENLERDGVGSLFPYNNDLYDTASGLYGPGTIICWYLLLASFIVNFTLCTPDEDGHRRPGVTTDLLALTIYPVFAATDALIQALKLIGVPDRGKVLFCLRFPFVDVSRNMHGPGSPGDPPLDLAAIPGDVVDYGQKIVALSGPIPVCYMFTTIVIAVLLGGLWYGSYCSDSSTTDRPLWQPTRGVWTLVGASYLYVVVCLTVLQLSLADFGMVLILAMYEGLNPCLFVAVHGFGFIVYVYVASMLCLALVELARWLFGRPVVEHPFTVKDIPGLVGVSLLAGFPCAFSLWIGDLTLTPDLGISVAESDQLAALLAGIVTLCFTLYSIFGAGHDDGGDDEKGEASGGVVGEMPPRAVADV